jgi:hypothetical protein
MPFGAVWDGAGGMNPERVAFNTPTWQTPLYHAPIPPPGQPIPPHSTTRSATPFPHLHDARPSCHPGVVCGARARQGHPVGRHAGGGAGAGLRGRLLRLRGGGCGGHPERLGAGVRGAGGGWGVGWGWGWGGWVGGGGGGGACGWSREQGGEGSVCSTPVDEHRQLDVNSQTVCKKQRSWSLLCC